MKTMGLKVSCLEFGIFSASRNSFQQMSEPRKVVLKVPLNCEKCKQRALRTAADLEGVDSVSVDNGSKITVIGKADPVSLACSLRKYGDAEIVSVQPVEKPPETNPGATKPESSTGPPTPQQPLVLLVPECTCFSEENPKS